MIFVISNLLILGCIPLRVAQLGSDHQYFRSGRGQKSAKMKTLSEFLSGPKISKHQRTRKITVLIVLGMRKGNIILIRSSLIAISHITPCISLLNFEDPASMLPYFSDSCSLDAVYHNRTLVSVLQYSISLNLSLFILYSTTEPVFFSPLYL
jgi:hypothetical protein